MIKRYFHRAYAFRHRYNDNFVHKDEFEEKEQQVLAGIHKAVNPDHIELESDLALIAIVGRGMRSTRGTAGRIFSALAHAHINVKMIDQGSSELNIIVGVSTMTSKTPSVHCTRFL